MYQGGLKNYEKTRKMFSHEKRYGVYFFIFNNFTPVISVYKKNLAKNGTLMDSLLRVGEHHV